MENSNFGFISIYFKLIHLFNLKEYEKSYGHSKNYYCSKSIYVPGQILFRWKHLPVDRCPLSPDPRPGKSPCLPRSFPCTISPQCLVSQHVEEHAYATYDAFLAENEEDLKKQPAPMVRLGSLTLSPPQPLPSRPDVHESRDSCAFIFIVYPPLASFFIKNPFRFFSFFFISVLFFLYSHCFSSSLLFFRLFPLSVSSV